MKEIRFVTTALPGPADECVFVELEDENGCGLGESVAEWLPVPDTDLWALTINLSSLLANNLIDKE